MAKTLQSAVETLERDKAQLQNRVHSLEQRLMGRQASEGGDSGVPSSGERIYSGSSQGRGVLGIFFFWNPEIQFQYFSLFICKHISLSDAVSYFL